MIGFVKVVKCSFDETTWYFDQIGQTFFIFAVEGDMLVVHHPFFMITTEEEAVMYTGIDCNFSTLYIHKNDVIPWLK